MSLCLSNGILIYPVVIGESYFEGKKKVNYVRIEINDRGKKTTGKDRYKQNEELTNKVYQLYEILKERI
jgi:N-acetyl-anhydromuramyl-L-alanine amidase AmpD